MSTTPTFARTTVTTKVASRSRTTTVANRVNTR
jgi:hypothetical protein